MKPLGGENQVMTPERHRFLDEHVTESLTKEEIEEGYFFCCDWDGMLMHKDDMEATNCCSCQAREKGKQAELKL
jgi:hypothetical protein